MISYENISFDSSLEHDARIVMNDRVRNFKFKYAYPYYCNNSTILYGFPVCVIELVTCNNMYGESARSYSFTLTLHYNFLTCNVKSVYDYEIIFHSKIRSTIDDFVAESMKSYINS